MQFNATSRSVQGSSASRRLRRAGRVPAIVYGAEGTPQSIELDHNEIYHALRKEEFHSSILSMQLDGKGTQVLLRAVQWHPYKPQVLHVDFQRVAAGQALHTKVPLHFVNAETSPAVKLSGAIINHVLNEVEVNCLPNDLPQFIEVDLGNIIAGARSTWPTSSLPRASRSPRAATSSLPPPSPSRAVRPRKKPLRPKRSKKTPDSRAGYGRHGLPVVLGKTPIVPRPGFFLSPRKCGVGVAGCRCCRGLTAWCRIGCACFGSGLVGTMAAMRPGVSAFGFLSADS